MAQYVYGKNVVAQILRDNKKIYQLLVMENSKNDDIVKLAKQQGVSLTLLPKKEMDKLVTERHQGVIAKIDDYKIYDLNDLLRGIPDDRIPLLVMLDGLEDPHNLGAILRTCDGVGVDGVIIMKNRSVTLTPTVAKVSCGAIDTIKVAQITNLTATIKELKKRGFWICGADNNDAQDYRRPDYQMPLVLVIGSEGSGISRLVRDNLDFSVKLPMLGQLSSLNASVAAGIMLYQIYDRRHPLK
ncbi:MAG: 23S rRNA (guanosine(2251)-2'-O)-methyltransferase RlmB [Erysipelotrichaceae bacterium]|nr:23S rRNA (guanosine(2251)-2'-O)-methyltransferase RlmB [Erysipelotrichaceae bacterium]